MRAAIAVGVLILLSLPIAASAGAPGRLVVSHTPEPGASPWATGMHSAVRLLDGGARPEDPGRRLAGLEIRMSEHFKTYWRTPGDSGLPPVFNWSGSQNLKSVEVDWPAPSRFDDSAGSSIGYKERVVLPLLVTPENPKLPVKLALALDYAVCEVVCIPARGEMKMELAATPMSGPQTPAIEAALARVPVKAALSSAAAPGIRSVTAVGDDRAVIVTAQTPPTHGVIDILTEGPDGWTFSAPLAVATLPGPHGSRLVTYRVVVDSRPEGGKLHGLGLSLTMTAGDEAVEVEASLDAKPPPH
jgi:DsbC/DsbD-like thiol-disulfide interchange protein